MILDLGAWAGRRCPWAAHRKVLYPTVERAMFHAVLLAATFGHQMRAYPCGGTSGWHLASGRGSDKQRESLRRKKTRQRPAARARARARVAATGG